MSIGTAKAVRLGKRRRKVDVASRSFSVAAGRCTATVRAPAVVVRPPPPSPRDSVKVHVHVMSKGSKVARRTVSLRG